MTPAGPDPELVVQVRARPSFGTGYRIAPGLVLTAAHVVTGAEGERPGTVTVARLGQEPADGDIVWRRRDASVDAALIRLRTRCRVETLQSLTPSTEDPHPPLMLAAVLVDHAANLAETGEPAEGADTADRAACREEAIGIVREEARGDRKFLAILADMLGEQAHCRAEAGDPAAAADACREETDIRYGLCRSDPSARPRLARSLADLSTHLQDAGRLPAAVSAAKESLGIYHDLYGYEPGEQHWQEVFHALSRCGTALLRSGAAAEAVAPFVHAMAMALKAGAMDLAAGCRSGIDLAHALDPAGAAAEWRRLVGPDLPDRST